MGWHLWKSLATNQTCPVQWRITNSSTTSQVDLHASNTVALVETPTADSESQSNSGSSIRNIVAGALLLTKETSSTDNNGDTSSIDGHSC